MAESTSQLSSVTEMIVSTCISRHSPQWGHDATWVAGGRSGFVSATTFTFVPHLHTHTARIRTAIFPLCLIIFRHRILTLEFGVTLPGSTGTPIFFYVEGLPDRDFLLFNICITFNPILIFAKSQSCTVKQKSTGTCEVRLD